MANNLTDYSQQLENQMENMSLYLEKLMQNDERERSEESSDFNITQEYLNEQPTQAHAPYLAPIRFFPSVQPTTSTNYSSMGTSLPHPRHMVTSVFANASKISSNNLVSNLNPRIKKRVNYKQEEYDPDTSGIDIDATMIELGLTPESLTPNKVYQLFSLFSDLEFSIHAEFITSSVYDLKTIPNTMSVSAQIKSAIKNSQKLLFNLFEALKRPMPVEYTTAYNECQEALEQLRQAIGSLEFFKHCTLEHHKGNFIGQDAKEYLEPLMATIKHLTECIKRSRMFVQVFEHALNCPQRYQAALLASHEEDHRQPLPEETYTEAPTCSNRSHFARRYIG